MVPGTIQVQAGDHLLDGEAGTIQLLPPWQARDGRGSWEPENMGRWVLGYLSADVLLHSVSLSVSYSYTPVSPRPAGGKHKALCERQAVPPRQNLTPCNRHGGLIRA